MAQTRRVWTYVILFALLLYSGHYSVFGEKLTPWYNNTRNVDGYNVVYNTQREIMSWWDASQNGCSSFGGTLALHIPGNFTDTLSLTPEQTEAWYWIGAIEYSTLNWTDGSSLYRYEGFLRLLTSGRYHPIPGNSAISCHQKCGSTYKHIGLQRSTCYCLELYQIKEATATHSRDGESQCLGNYHDRCGDDDGVSIYTIDIQEGVTLVSNNQNNCGYIELSWNLLTLSLHPTVRDDLRFTTNCGESLCAVCNETDIVEKNGTEYTCAESVCLSRTSAPWDEWRRRHCSLVKLTGDILQQINALNQSDHSQCNGKYWIGLKSYNEQVWNDGQNVVTGSIAVGDVENTFPRCLALHIGYMDDIHTKQSWESCDKTYFALCEKRVKSNETTHTTEKSITTTERVTEVISKPAKTVVTAFIDTQSAMRVTTTTTTTTTLATGTTTPLSLYQQSIESNNENKIGVYAGGIVAAVAVISVSLFTIITYRRKSCCFKSNIGSPRADFKESTELANSSSALVKPTVSCSRDSNVPIATVTPTIHVIQNTKINDEGESVDYYNVSSKAKRNTEMSNLSDGSICNHKPNRLSDSPGSPIGPDHEHIYNVAGESGKDLFLSKDYAQNNSSTDGIYHVLEEPCNAKHQVPNAAYDRVGFADSENQYDTTRQTKQEYHSDSAYIDEVGIGYSGGGNVESDYDTTRPGEVRPKLSSTDDYSHIDDHAFMTNMTGHDYSYPNKCQDASVSNDAKASTRQEKKSMDASEVEPIEEADYYNIGSSSDTLTARDATKANNDDVYTLAKVI